MPLDGPRFDWDFKETLIARRSYTFLRECEQARANMNRAAPG